MGDNRVSETLDSIRFDESRTPKSNSMLRFDHHTIPSISLRPPGSESPPGTILHLSFNHTQTCFAAGTDRGFRIYKCDPFRATIVSDIDLGGVSIVEIRSHIWALVGRNQNNKVMIWNNLQSRFVGELQFRSQVRSVRLGIDRIVAVLEHKLRIHRLEDLRVVHEIETFSNPKGLCAIAHQGGSMVLVCPGLRRGQVRVVHYHPKKSIYVLAHDCGIACLALTLDGKFLATTSSKGTLIRVFSTSDGSLHQEVRRGTDKADIYSLAFSPNSQWLAVSSDKGTIHVFRLKDDHKMRSASAPSAVVRLSSASLSLIRGILPKYFSSEWSVARFRLHEGSKYVVAFGHQYNTVQILGMNGSFYRCQFDTETGGEMIRLEDHSIFVPE